MFQLFAPGSLHSILLASPENMHSFTRRIGVVILLGSLIGCTESPLDPLQEGTPAARTTGLRQEGLVVADPEEPGVTINSGECTFERVDDGSAEGSWVSTCEGISGGTTLPPPPPPPPPPPSFPPPSGTPVISGGGSGSGSSGDGSGGEASAGPNPLCAGALGTVAGLKIQQNKAQETYAAAYDAYVKKYAEYKAWDNQARSDGVYTWPEQQGLFQLGDQLRALESAMNDAKAILDRLNNLVWSAELIAGVACLV